MSRSELIQTLVTDQEKRLVKRLAENAQRSVSAYVRIVLLDTIEKSGVVAKDK